MKLIMLSTNHHKITHIPSLVLVFIFSNFKIMIVLLKFPFIKHIIRTMEVRGCVPGKKEKFEFKICHRYHPYA